jgi:hypothetical protein
MFSLVALIVNLIPVMAALAIDYSVPVTDESLEIYSKFKIDVSCSKKDGILTVEYTLPLMLTGSPRRVSLTLNSESATSFSGDLGSMTCDGVKCAVKFENLNLIESEVEEEVFFSSTEFTEFFGKMAVAMAFRKDPGGIFHGDPTVYCAN